MEICDIPQSTIAAEVKLVVVGNSKVGKTSILSQLCASTYSQNYTPTVGVEYEVAILQVDGKQIKVHLYDTSGQPSFLYLAKGPVQEADGFVFVYDVSSDESFHSLQKWHHHVQRFAKERNLPKLLLGNKSDLRHKQTVGTAQAREYCIPEGMIQVETSARLGRCVHMAFSLLVSEILKYRKLGTVRVLGAPTDMAVFSSEMFEPEEPRGDLHDFRSAQRELEDYTHLFKIMLLGAPRVGKTALRYRFCKDYFNAEYIATAGFDYSVRSLVVDEERVKVQLWDVSGDQLYDATRESYMKGANAFIILYDITNKDSFVKAEFLLKYLDMVGLDQAPKMLVGNKCDSQKKKAVEFNTGKDFADGWRLPFLETSAKQATNIDTAVMRIVLALKRQLSPWKKVYTWS